MSGLLERIVRRRRASASSRLGPPTQNGHPSPFEGPYLNGHEIELPVMHVNGNAGVVDMAEVAEPAEVPAEVQVEAEAIEVLEVAEAPEAAAVPEAVEIPETEPGQELGEPARIDDESPTMEHRVLILDEAEDHGRAELQAIAVTEPEPEPEPVAVIEPEPVVADEPEPEPAEPPVPEPRFRERGRIRRRARYLRRLREVQLRDLGGLMLELHRFGRERPDLLQAKITGAAQTDAELRALDHALGVEEPLRELRIAGIGGVCDRCGALHGSDDRFCATCGESLGRNSQAGRSPEFGPFFTQG